MAKIDDSFKQLVNYIFHNGYDYEDPYRKGVKRREITDYKFRHNLLEDGFPALTLKDLWFKGVKGELLWFLRGEDNISWLVENGINIWNKDVAKFYTKIHDLDGEISPENLVAHIMQGATNDGYAGRIYGTQWRDWYGGVGTRVDQIEKLINGMKTRPYATDLIVTAWNPAELANMALPPCHFGFQVVGRPLTLNERKSYYKKLHKGGAAEWVDLSTFDHGYFDEVGVPKDGFVLIWDQRSVDTFLGLPFNIASYALLAYILGEITEMVPVEVVGSLRNVHLYDNSFDAVEEFLSRDTNKFPNCELSINETTQRVLRGEKSLDEKLSMVGIPDFKLVGYDSYPPLKVEMLARD